MLAHGVAYRCSVLCGVCSGNQFIRPSHNEHRHEHGFVSKVVFPLFSNNRQKVIIIRRNDGYGNCANALRKRGRFRILATSFFFFANDENRFSDGNQYDSIADNANGRMSRKNTLEHLYSSDHVRSIRAERRWRAPSLRHGLVWPAVNRPRLHWFFFFR